VYISGKAAFTVTAVDSWIYSDALPNFEALNPFTNIHNDSCGFMAEREWAFCRNSADVAE
jgi:hypothetical protein